MRVPTENKGDFFLLFANCIPVRGFKRSIIIDLQRGAYIYIPNSLFELINELKTRSINHVLNTTTGLTHEVLDSYIEYIEEYDMGFFTNDINKFPSLSTTYDLPYKILDAIIEVSHLTITHLNKIYNELTLLGCQHLELRSYRTLDIATIESMLLPLSFTRLRSVDIYLKHSEIFSDADYIQLLKKYQLIGKLIIHTSPHNVIFDDYDNHRLIYISQEISNSSCCGVNITDYKMISQSFYLESINYNNCLYRKISIDQLGNIKNCPSLENSYGNVASKNLVEVSMDEGFKSIGLITKDKIQVCMDCEYRYICSDCRAYLSDPYSKPLNCNYDPYTNLYN